MSEAIISGTDTVYVRLLGERVDVWRPVPGYPLGGNAFELSDSPVPDDELWEFPPGSRVVVKSRHGSPDDYPVAIAIADPTPVIAHAARG